MMTSIAYRERRELTPHLSSNNGLRVPRRLRRRSGTAWMRCERSNEEPYVPSLSPRYFRSCGAPFGEPSAETQFAAVCILLGTQPFINAIAQSCPQHPLGSHQLQPLGTVLGQQGAELQNVQFLYSPAEGQISFRVQFGQSGLRDLHVRRPWRIRRCENTVQSSSGTTSMRSCSIFTGS